MTNIIITTAVPVSEKQLTTMTQALKKKVSGDIAVTTKVDPHVIGGLRLTVGSQEYDGTVQTKLEHIRESLVAQL